MNIPLDEWSGARATKELQATLEKFNAENSKHTKHMIYLTWVIAGLTFVMLLAVIVQIIICAK